MSTRSTSADFQSPSGRPRRFLRFVAIVEAILAAIAAFLTIAFLPDGTKLGGDGIGEGFRSSFIGAFAVAALLLAYGAVRTWRAARYWWWPFVAVLGAVPLVFILLLL